MDIRRSRRIADIRGPVPTHSPPPTGTGPRISKLLRKPPSPTRISECEKAPVLVSPDKCRGLSRPYLRRSRIRPAKSSSSRMPTPESRVRWAGTIIQGWRGPTSGEYTGTNPWSSMETAKSTAR